MTNKGWDTGCDCGQCQLGRVYWDMYSHKDVDKATETMFEVVPKILETEFFADMDEHQRHMKMMETAMMVAEAYIAAHPDESDACVQFGLNCMVRAKERKRARIAH